MFPDWKPSSTIDKTDIVGAIEAVEGIYTYTSSFFLCLFSVLFPEVQPQIKDKSAWRKSTLNVANSTEETKEDNYLGRHTLPRSHRSENILHSIQEDNKDLDRKGFISSLGERPPTDKLTLYIRKTGESLPSPNGDKKSNLGSVPRRIRDSQQSIDSISNNKVEIDQDNIETPPATRKIFTPTPVDKREPLQPSPCSRRLGRANREAVLSPEEPEINPTLGDGQFDRYSATRRTRRYKRNQDNSEASSPSEIPVDMQVVKSTTQIEISPPVDVESGIDKEIRLKAWQEKLKTQCEQDRKSRRHQNDSDIGLSSLELNSDNMNVSTTYITPEKTKVRLRFVVM